MENSGSTEGVGVNVISLLRKIEGGRAVDANEVLARFASVTEALSTGTRDMAGFAVLVWDDEGRTLSAVHVGRRNPFAPILVPEMAKTHFTRGVLTQ